MTFIINVRNDVDQPQQTHAIVFDLGGFMSLKMATKNIKITLNINKSIQIKQNLGIRDFFILATDGHSHVLSKSWFNKRNQRKISAAAPVSQYILYIIVYIVMCGRCGG